LHFYPSKAMKIHVSETTKELLDDHGGFSMEHRGTIEIKVGYKFCSSSTNFLQFVMFPLMYWLPQGKGEMETFWLLGHEKLKEENLLPLQVDEIYHLSTCEPEFLQMIWATLNLRGCQLML
jgi:hypothetical protein